MTDPLEVSREDLRAVYDPEMHLMMLRDSSRHRFYARCLLEHRTELEGKAGEMCSEKRKAHASPV